MKFLKYHELLGIWFLYMNSRIWQVKLLLEHFTKDEYIVFKLNEQELQKIILSKNKTYKIKGFSRLKVQENIERSL